jgi:hypothetical protein
MAKQRRSLVQAATPREMAATPAELEAAVLARREQQAEPAPMPEAPRVKMTISIDSDLLRELRVMASTLPPALFPSISGAIVEATRDLVDRMRLEHNDGAPFTSDTKPKVRTGRRPGR